MGTSLPTLQRLSRLAGTIECNWVRTGCEWTSATSLSVAGTQLRARHAQILLQPVQKGGRHFTVAPHINLIDSGSCKGRQDPSSGEKPNAVGSISAAGTYGLPTMSCWTCLPLPRSEWTKTSSDLLPWRVNSGPSDSVHCPKTMAELSTPPPGAVLSFVDCRALDALGGTRTLCDLPRVGSVSWSRMRCFSDFVLSNRATDSCALSLLDSETLHCRRQLVNDISSVQLVRVSRGQKWPRSPSGSRTGVWTWTSR